MKIVVTEQKSQSTVQQPPLEKPEEQLFQGSLNSEKRYNAGMMTDEAEQNGVVLPPVTMSALSKPITSRSHQHLLLTGAETHYYWEVMILIEFIDIFCGLDQLSLKSRNIKSRNI